jgi:hypothetical protein
MGLQQKPHALRRTAASFRSMVPMVLRGAGCTLEASRAQGSKKASRLREAAIVKMQNYFPGYTVGHLGGRCAPNRRAEH